MKRVDRSGCGVDRRVGIGGVVVNKRRRLTAGRHDKRHLAKATDKFSRCAPIFDRLDIALIPGHSKRSIRHLNHEEIKIGFGRQVLHRHFHFFDRPFRFDLDSCRCGLATGADAAVWKVFILDYRRRAHHLKLAFVRIQ